MTRKTNKRIFSYDNNCNTGLDEEITGQRSVGSKVNPGESEARSQKKELQMKNNLNVIDLIIVDTSKEVINTDEGPNE